MPSSVREYVKDSTAVGGQKVYLKPGHHSVVDEISRWSGPIIGRNLHYGSIQHAHHP
jgi:hypothetical protein